VEALVSGPLNSKIMAESEMEHSDSDIDEHSLCDSSEHDSNSENTRGLGEGSSNSLRAQIRHLSRKSENVRKSLQACGLTNNRDVLKGHIERLEKTQIIKSFVYHLKGIYAVLELLQAHIPTASGQDIVQSYLSFNEAFSLYISYDLTSLPSKLKQQHVKERFRELLCHPRYGLCVYILKCENGEAFVS
jgi:hypothetical protein